MYLKLYSNILIKCKGYHAELSDSSHVASERYTQISKLGAKPWCEVSHTSTSVRRIHHHKCQPWQNWLCIIFLIIFPLVYSTPGSHVQTKSCNGVKAGLPHVMGISPIRKFDKRVIHMLLCNQLNKIHIYDRIQIENKGYIIF